MYQCFIIPYLYEAQHVSGDIPSIIRSLKLHWQPLVFNMWKAVGRVFGGLIRHTVTDNVLMMGGVSPATCLASYKYGIIIKFDTLLRLGFFYELHYAARIQEH
jgi:hypothetical protein